MLNQFVGMGRITTDLELKTTSNGKNFASFSIAVDRDYVKSGEERGVDFIPCIIWGKQAEFVCRNFKKGALIALVGQLQSNKFNDKEGKSRTSYTITVEKISFTGEKINKDNSAPNVSVSNDTPATTSSSDGFVDTSLDDDLPF